MFALLEHSTADGVHWDFLVEAAGLERLPTWRLAANPIGAAGPIAAERIADHRSEYLAYEGEISGGRGVVRRLDRGGAAAIHWSNTLVILQLAGERLYGRAVLRSGAEADWFFELERGGSAVGGSPS